jgi:tRNA(Arg) A34 adenosine deaminase TadA
MNFSEADEQFMQRALELARRARDLHEEIPVGAVIVRDDIVVGEGWNQCVTGNDPSAHAEIIALRSAGQKLQNYRLPGTTLYVTLEPCVMCAGAIVHARVNRVVIGADDPKTGAAGTVFDTLISDKHNHHVDVTRGLLADDSSRLLREFFRERRGTRSLA